MTKARLENIYLKIIEGGIYLSLFAPLVLMKSFFFPYVVPKTIFFRIVIDIVFIVYILLVISNRRYLPRITPLAIAVFAFVAVSFVTSIFGVDFNKSFWSVFERMTGLLTFLHLFVFFIILSGVFKERKSWDRILTVSIIAGTFIGLYALLSDNPTNRGGATIGNVSFLAAYELFNVFFAVYLLVIKRNIWKVLYATALIIILSSLFFAPELPRGGIGALLPGAGLLIVGYMFFSGSKKLKLLAPALLIIASLAAVVFFQSDYCKKNIIDFSIDFPGEAREVVWKMGFDAFKEKPVFGWGQENFNVAFAKYFNPRIPLSGDMWYDRAHNVVVDVAVASGILGLVSYLAIFIIAIIGLFKMCFKVVDRKNLFIPLSMVSLLLVYFFQNMWVFDMISSYLIFFLSLAFINYLISGEGKADVSEKQERFSPSFVFLGGFLIILSLIIFYFGNIQPALASHYTVMGIISPLEDAVTNFEKAIKASPMSIVETPEQFSRRISESVFDDSQDQKTLVEGFEIAGENLQKAINRMPEDYRIYLVAGRHYNNFYIVTQDFEKLTLAEEFLNKGIEISPNNQQTYWTLAQTKMYQGKAEEALSTMQKAVDVEPNFPISWWYLAMTHKALGENIQAIEAIEKGGETGLNWKNDVDKLRKVLEIYQQLGNFEKLKELYLYGISISPQSADFYGGLAVTYANLEEYDDAKVYAQKAVELNPSYKEQLDKFLNELPN